MVPIVVKRRFPDAPDVGSLSEGGAANRGLVLRRQELFRLKFPVERYLASKPAGPQTGKRDASDSGTRSPRKPILENQSTNRLLPGWTSSPKLFEEFKSRDPKTSTQLADAYRAGTIALLLKMPVPDPTDSIPADSWIVQS